MDRLAFSTLVCLLLATPAKACGLALALLVDISGSVDPREYRVQMEGLAAALRDGSVAEALLRQQAALTLIQWTGSSRQEVSIPWTALHRAEDLDAFARAVETAPRPWAMFATAIGEALAVAERVLDDAPPCRRQVIDISGDGISNEGTPPATVRDRLAARGVTINALVITGSEPDVLPHFHAEVIGGPNAFALAANGYADYPERIRRKLIRETASALSQILRPPDVAPGDPLAQRRAAHP